MGTLGSLLIITAFVATLIAAYAFWRATNEVQETEWKTIGRWSWGIMVTAIFVASILLIYLIATHQFQFSYVFRYSSKDLPIDYLFSSFWAGQEGSFLLWIFFTGIIGLVLFKTANQYEASVMTIIAFCQFFLILMVVGIKLGPLMIGSSPFLTTAEQFPDAPILQTPGFIPSDGQGLNDLLQNYWMMIHPPTLFIGFSTMIVPFAYAIAGLWKKQYTQWVKPALPWALFSNLILIIGITMGGYWAYITLSFGGYWAWDPVENSSLVPWLIGVAGIHTMISQKQSASSQKAAIFLNIFAFLLVVYSTFLTRSGILGDISVHSFVDLGLYNLLLLWILAMVVVGFGLFFYRYKELPKPRAEVATLSREFMIFSGAMVLCAIAAVIILGTSSPIVGKVFRDSPSAVPIEFYDAWTLPLAVLLALFAGIGQLFWWNKMKIEQLNKVLFKPLLASTILTVLVMILTPFVQETTRPSATGSLWEMYGTSLMLVFLVFMSFFALFGNGMVLWRIGRNNLKLAGGSIAHIGLALMLFGIITSATFSNPLSGDLNNSVPENGSSRRNNFIIQPNQTLQVENYKVTYVGTEQTPEGYTAYVLDYKGDNGKSFRVKPVVYKSKKNQWIQHPDLKSYFEKDVYVAVSPSVMTQNPETQNQSAGEFELKKEESRTLGGGEYRVDFKQFVINLDPELIPENTQIAVGARLEVTHLPTNKTEVLTPIYLIMNDGNNSQQFIQNKINEWGLTFTFAGMNISQDGAEGAAKIIVEGASVDTDEWLVVQSYEKPFINLLWFGAIIMFLGFGVSVVRRAQEQR